MTAFDFGALSPYVADDAITDVNYNGRHLWLDHLEKGRYVDEDFYPSERVEQLCYRFANHANKAFNQLHPVLEAETDTLRISMTHEAITKSGYSISIRKTPAVMRLQKQSMIKTAYADAEVLQLLETLVQARCNILICGLPGAGKTELAKYLTSFIPAHQRVITIEDTLEIRYADIHPHKDCVSIKVHGGFGYVAAIKASLRQRPDWLLLSEVRSHEVVQLMESVSTGAKLISTLHADDAKSIPMRLLHMFPGVELSNEVLLHTIYETIDIGIHVEAQISSNGIKRYIKEIVCFDIDSNHRVIQYPLFHKFRSSVIAALPDKIIAKMNEVPKRKVAKERKNV